MTAQKTEDAEPVADRSESVNEVRLVGRLSGAPEVRTVAGETEVVQLRVAIERPAQEGQRRRTDTLECTVWDPRLQKRILKWVPESTVEISGALRRRFWKAGAGVASRTDVEATGGRIIRRAGTG